MPKIDAIDALEILDSRGRPTVQASVRLSDGTLAKAQVPSGASTGKAEALELRDGDSNRHAGLGCLKAVAAIRTEIAFALCHKDWPTQRDLDDRMVELDGTPSKSRLGANAILAVSLAYARASALKNGRPLYEHLALLAGIQNRHLPRPTINLFSGGKHAGTQVAIQDVLIIPASVTRMAEALEQASAVFHSAGRLSARKYGTRNLVADEGGLAPAFPDVPAMIADAVEAVELAGLEPGKDIMLGIDVAASHFFDGIHYHLDGRQLAQDEMIAELAGWVRKYPIASLEDGLAENDWEGWKKLYQCLHQDSLILGDDLLCSNAGRVSRAVDQRAANALLLKVNQIGTLTEALEAWTVAKSDGWHITVSARSGETEDTWLADLAVGLGADHIKIGSITRSERLSKYNRLLEIEQETGWGIPATSSTQLASRSP